MVEELARLLVVDDEASLVVLLQRYLTRLGYEVESCPDAEQALERFEKQPDRYAAVLADLTLPGMSGEEMVVKMLAVRPDLPVLVCSGLPLDPSLFAAQGRRVEFLQKPFLPKMLADALQKVLKPRT